MCLQEAEQKRTQDADQKSKDELAQTIKASEDEQMRKKLEEEQAFKNAQLNSMFEAGGSGAAAAGNGGGLGGTSALPSIGGGRGRGAALFDEIQINDDDNADVRADKE